MVHALLALAAGKKRFTGWTLALAASASLTGASAQQLAAPPLLPDGPLGTLPIGNYQCGLPGDATGAAFSLLPEEGFVIVSGSRYRAQDDEGLYLLRGKQLVFTSGPRKGERFLREGENSLRKLAADGALSSVICLRRSDCRARDMGSESESQGVSTASQCKTRASAAQGYSFIKRG